jgi:hypothetical protein
MNCELFRTVLVLTDSKRTEEGVYIIPYSFVAALGIGKCEEQ